jgi:hypothetical protein
MDGMSVTETLPFQAETKQLLDIVIHSLYSNKEIFLRELLSNASDALDKLKLEALERHSLLDEDPLLEIELVPDSKARTLTVSDSGIGMTRDELVRLIGTIAKSGTRRAGRTVEERALHDTAADADRPVRRRLLLVVHGRGPGGDRHPAGGDRRGHPVGVHRRRHLHDQRGVALPTRHRHRAAPQDRWTARTASPTTPARSAQVAGQEALGLRGATRSS